MPSPTTFWQSRFPRLRYCIVWLAFLWMRGIVILPLPWQLALGRLAGRLSRYLVPGRQAVVRRNLDICFPELPAEERAALGRRHFEELGLSIIEMANGWYGNVADIEAHVTFEGLEHLRAALEKGSGVILFSAHFTAFEYFFPALRRHCPRLSGMYKMQRNPLMNEIMNAGRGRNFDCLFPKDNVRDLLRELAANAVVWYASDQKFAGKSSALLPFFGEPAMTNTAIGRIAARSGATVLPYFCRRLPGATPRYVGTIGAPLEEFHSKEPEDGIRRFVTMLEDFIRKCPEQYWWVHKRFAGRPASYPNVYSRESARG